MNETGKYMPHSTSPHRDWHDSEAIIRDVYVQLSANHLSHSEKLKTLRSSTSASPDAYGMLYARNFISSPKQRASLCITNLNGEYTRLLDEVGVRVRKPAFIICDSSVTTAMRECTRIHRWMVCSQSVATAPNAAVQDQGMR